MTLLRHTLLRRLRRTATRTSGEQGSALVEFVFLAVLMMVPLIYLVMVLARLQAGSYAASAAVREAGRAYVTSRMSDDPWISSHLELRGEKGEILSGYGWVFPLGNGSVNLGAGTLATIKRPADVAIKPLMALYADTIRDEFGLGHELRMPTSALLPMGGAVSNVAGANWALIGDAAACVNPLNGEGIDYGLETGRLVAEQLHEGADLGRAWPALLTEHYGEAFSIARRLAGIAAVPQVLKALGPAGMRSDWLMTLALRWMGNLVTDEDRDRAARVWRWAGRRSIALDHRPPFS